MVLHFSCTPCARRMLWLALLQGLVFYAPVATLYRQVRGISLFQITLMEGISLGLSIVLELPWGIVSERIGYRRTLLFCSALYLLSKIIFWQANGFFLFLLERLLLAVVLAGFSGVDAAYLTAVTPSSQRQRIFGLYEGASTAGLLLGDLVFSFLPPGDYSEAALLTVFAYTAALLCAFGLKEVPCQQISQKFSFQFFLSLFLKGRVILLLIGSALLLESCQTITVFFSQPLMTAAGFPSPFIGCTSWSNGFVWFFIVVYGTHLQIDGTAKCPVAGFTVHCACVSHIGASIVLAYSGAFTAVVPLYLRYSGPFIPCTEERSCGRCWKYGRKAFSSKLFDEFAGGCYQSVFWHCRPEKSLLRNYNGDSFFSGSFYIFHYLLYTQTDDSLQKVKKQNCIKKIKAAISRRKWRTKHGTDNRTLGYL